MSFRYERRGFCAFCETTSLFAADDPWLRDAYKCTTCGSLPRQRALLEVLNLIRPAWRQLDIHECAPSMPYFSNQCPTYSYSFNDNAAALAGHGTTEDIQALSFDSGRFDLFITQDVLEHVFDVAAALQEVMRVLRPNGLHIFTIPRHSDLAESRQRAALIDGKVEHLADPAYHSDPVASGRSLVVWDFGVDFESCVERWNGVPVSTVHLRDHDRGLEGEHLEVFVMRKPASVASMSEYGQGPLLVRTIGRLEGELADLASRFDDLLASHRAVLDSSSWRATKPFRDVATRLRRIGRRKGGDYR